MASTFLNISTDNTLGGGGASDSIISSQKAIKDYIDSQVDGVETSELTLATVATTGAYSDLSGTPTIPTTTDSVTQSSTAALTSGGAYTAFSAKQDVLTAGSNISISKSNFKAISKT